MIKTEPTGKSPTRPATTSTVPPKTVSASASTAASPGPVSITDPSQLFPILSLVGLVALLIAAYWDMFAITSAVWSEGLYSHGWIVPIFALGLLWLRFEPFAPVPAIDRWIGLGILAAGLSLRIFASEYFINTFERLSFIPCMFGIFMLVGGMRTIRWAWPALFFLLFMFPLPTFFEVKVLNSLQRIASISSTFVLQTLGVSAFRQGNLISIPGMAQPLTIADACSGLRMATIFGALSVAMAFIIERPWWDKFVILLSALPIALIVNIVRITVTGLLYMAAGQDNIAVQKICHDYAGLVIMMPLAMALLWLELQILERITIPVDAVQLRPVGGARATVGVPIR